MSDIVLSVIIPVFDREAVLMACLDSLGQCHLETSWEVVIACDGGPESMRGAATARWQRADVPLRWLQLPKGGPSRTRNVAIRESRGGLILFLNDDVILHPDLLQEHVDLSRRFPEALIVGNTRWYPGCVSTPFMHWLAHQEHHTYLIDDLENTTWEYWHTLNCSLSRGWFVDKDQWFDEAFPDPAFEDTEYAYRLAKAGARFVLAPHAIAWHNHHYTPEGRLAKMRMVGKSARHFVNLYPETRARILGGIANPDAATRLKLKTRDLLHLSDGPEQWELKAGMAFREGYGPAD